MSSMMVKKLELIENFMDMNLGMVLCNDHNRYSQLTITNDLWNMIKEEQLLDDNLKRIFYFINTK